MDSDLTIWNGLSTMNSISEVITENSSSIGNTSGRESLKALTASDRLSADPVWNSIPGKKRFGLAQTVKVRPSEVKLILTLR